jgi:hypothetical protein
LPASWQRNLRSPSKPELGWYRWRAGIAGGAVDIRLEPKDFIVYRVLAEWAKAAVASAGPNGVGDDHKGWITIDML